ncbi:hypothetical protein [Aggregatibacter actinomycetemcomitans]|uniref:hypothetical protein n=1 Tax=Aggregatibacter actinomycetemcomitans TaxID=714 RepID=UPI00043754B0|nr:hypothetical protein [Aggregatibacter actinomycetemcomitans]AHN72553.1 hypothetical protein CF65_02431 [Aggregatibacter actinomycetemcomitans HK1651]QPQ81320.1 hypothetical protein I6H05_03140 [Aggregatibacter actinomycetemcomitans]
MDFQFTAYQGNIITKRSMEYSVFANRFNIEVRSDPQLNRSQTELEEIGFIVTPQSLPFAALKISPVFCTLN